jgi:hypothetical protein
MRMTGLAGIVISLYFLPVDYFIGFSDKMTEKMDLGTSDEMAMNMIGIYLIVDIFAIFYLTVILGYYVDDYMTMNDVVEHDMVEHDMVEHDMVEGKVELSCEKNSD